MKASLKLGLISIVALACGNGAADPPTAPSLGVAGDHRLV